MAHLSKTPAGSWIACVKIKGTRKSKTFKKKGDAVSWSRKLESTLEKESKGLGKERWLHELLDVYIDKVAAFKKSCRSEVVRLNRFKKELNNRPLSKVSKQWLNEWVEARLLMVSPDSVNRDLNSLSSAFQYGLTELEWIGSNPVREVKRPAKSKPRDRLISQ